MKPEEKKSNEVIDKSEKKTVLKVIIHSFFVVPFLIALFSVVVYLMVRVLTAEPNTAYDYLNHVKIGGTTKRWQGAFELSKILSNPKHIPTDDRFVQELISVFEYSARDRDPRIRSYLAMAMGRTGDIRYAPSLIGGLEDAHMSVSAACAYALGMVQTEDGFNALMKISTHSEPRVRLQAVIALGNYMNINATEIFISALNDDEVNVRWDAALSLAKLKNNSGRKILLDLLDRKYLDSFPNIDPFEQDQALLATIQVIPNVLDLELKKALLELQNNDRKMEIRKAARKALKISSSKNG